METINIRLAAFEGPLDLLYHLIEKNEIDIYDIPIAALTEQYLAYLDAAEDRDMDGMSEFLLMAATLLEIKSKLLLPSRRQRRRKAPTPERSWYSACWNISGLRTRRRPSRSARRKRHLCCIRKRMPLWQS